VVNDGEQGEHGVTNAVKAKAFVAELRKGRLAKGKDAWPSSRKCHDNYRTICGVNAAQWWKNGFRGKARRGHFCPRQSRPDKWPILTLILKNTSSENRTSEIKSFSELRAPSIAAAR